MQNLKSSRFLHFNPPLYYWLTKIVRRIICLHLFPPFINYSHTTLFSGRQESLLFCMAMNDRAPLFSDIESVFRENTTSYIAVKMFLATVV